MCFLKRIFLLITLLGWFFYLPASAPPLKSEKTLQEERTKKMEKLSKDVNELKNSLEKFQKQLLSIIQEFNSLKIKKTGIHSKKSDITFDFIENFRKYLEKRWNVFSTGALSAIQMIAHPPHVNWPWQIHFLGLFINLVIGIFSVGIGRWLIKSRLTHLSEKTKKNSIEYLSLISTVLIVFSICYFFFSFIIDFYLCVFKFFRKYTWRSIYGSFFPFTFYVVWAGFYWIQLALSPGHPSKALIETDSYGSYRSTFWIRMALIIYLLGTTFLAFIEILPMTFVMTCAVSDTTGLLVSFCVWKGLSIVKKHIVQTDDTPRILRSIFLLRILVVSLFGLWLMGRELFDYFLVPILITVLVFLLLDSLEQGVQRIRIRLLWKVRHTSFFLKPLLTSQKIIVSVVRYGTYLALGYLWMTYFWNENNNNIDFSWIDSIIVKMNDLLTPAFNITLILSVAILLVKGGERILQYYVEEKYNMDSTENNFLASRLKTLMAMLKTTLHVIIWIPTFSMILSRFNVDVAARVNWIIGGAGLALTFGFQSIIRDFITGFFIILENNLMVGDEVEIEKNVGKVEAITLRTLKIRADNGSLLTIPFGSITMIGNRNRQFSAVVMNISVEYRENLERVQTLIERAFSLLKKTPIVGRRVLGSLEIRGINDVTSYSVVFQIKIKTAPNAQDTVRRAYNKYLKQLFDDAGIVVPQAPHTVLKAAPSLTNTTNA